jgi:anionic cell wall polymer biosynthesis LytR-Cps2A-Psr (LCP) family protein
VPFSTRIIDKNVNLDVPAGCHTFSGDEALAYVRSRHLKWVDDEGVAHEDRASDLGRISRQQDFLRRTLQAALDKGVFNPDVARALLESLQKYIVRDEGLTSLDALMGFAGVLRDVDPATISTYQIEASRLIVSGNDVLEPKVKGENMQSILRIFQGIDPLAGRPQQVFETTTTTIAPGDTAAVTLPPDSTVPGDTVAPPDENVKGDIVPDETITC